MRHLFVPACLCVMTWSNTTGFDLPIDKFQGSAGIDKKVLTRTAKAGGRAVDEPPSVEPAVTVPVAPSEAPARDAAQTLADIETATAVAQVPPQEVPSQIAAEPRPAIDPHHVPLPPVAKPAVHRSREEICETVSKAAQSNALPIAYFVRLLFQESRFDPASVSTAGAQGIAQFMPETAATEGLKNPFDPLQAIPASARLLRKLFDQFGNLGLAAAAYNAGPKRIQDWLGKKSKLPQETEGYVKIITGRPAESWRVASASGTALTVPNRAPCKNVVPPPTPPEKPALLIAAKAPAKTVAAKAPAHKHDKVIRIAVAAKPAKTPAAKAPVSQHHKVKAPTEQLAAARKHQQKHTHLAQR